MSLSGEGPPMATDEMLTTKEFAEACGVSRSTVCRWVEEGQLAYDERLSTNGRMKFHASKIAKFKVKAKE